MATEPPDAILNENMMTLHRRKPGGQRLETDCGHRFAPWNDGLCVTSMDRAAEYQRASKCGDCFEEGGGY